MCVCAAVPQAETAAFYVVIRETIGAAMERDPHALISIDISITPRRPPVDSILLERLK